MGAVREDEAVLKQNGDGQAGDHDAAWRSFENYVASLYEGLGFKVVTNANLSGQQIDILAEKSISGMGLIRLVIECKYRARGSVSNQDVFDFISMINAIKERDMITKAFIVTNTGFSKEAFSAAQASSVVELINSRTLENSLFELHDSYREYIKEYEATEIFTNYVPLRANVRHLEPTGRKKAGNTRKVADVERGLIDLIDSSEVSFISVLADYGSGKTTLLQRLKYHYSNEYVSRATTIKPFLIPLKNFHKMASLDALIQDCSRREFGKEMPLTLFWRTAADGELLLLLDGFDEMAPQVDEQRRQENFMALSPLFTLRSKAVLTCRPSYFVTEEEYENAIRLVNEMNGPGRGPYKSSDRKNFRAKKEHYNVLLNRLFSHFVDYKPLRSISRSHTAVVDLHSFDEQQVDSFLMKFDDRYKETCGRDWRGIKEFLMSIYDLSDLMSRPILLNMINVTILESRTAIFSDTQTLGPSSLYDLYTTTQLAMDWGKGEARQFLTREQRRMFAESIALGMFDARKLEVSYDEILDVAKRHDSVLGKLRSKLESVSAEEVATDIQICTFLSRDQNGFFRFSHKSFMEYFVALHLKKAMQSNRLDKRFGQFLPKEVLYFLGGCAYVESGLRQLLIEWFKNKTPTSDVNTFRRNLAGALFYSGREHKNLNLENATISGVDIIKSRMVRARFKNIKFDRVTQEKVIWENTTGQNIEFDKSSINDWELSGCALSCNSVATSAHNVRARDSKVVFNGRRAALHVSHFEQCDVEATGSVEFERCRFNGGSLRISSAAGFGSLIFEGCQFTGVSITSSPDAGRQSVSLSGCSFRDSYLLGLRLSGKDFLEMPFEGCRGVLIIDKPLFKLKNKYDDRRENILADGNLILVLARSWANEALRPHLLSKISKISPDFAEELGKMLG